MNLESELVLKMLIQDITLFGLLLPAIPLKMVAVNFRYTALAGLIRQIHQMARHTGEQIPASHHTISTSKDARNADHLRQIQLIFCWLVLSF